ncbi:hypothetical protein TSOC_001260 [Tetrabaena socialis]|uniref:Uncharacterized protein n=1 Tax=Tetrabaena socialis TaxID=47790 RepID=A0A2J8AH92_9CHLO|nr:hypothetical protein TSOC_001260 [Tetrabaena socialis]|eukprot:PNH11861.1 hypothetical protein TSOC_001260 [Tetrabaena socialis]
MPCFGRKGGNKVQQDTEASADVEATADVEAPEYLGPHGYSRNVESERGVELAGYFWPAFPSAPFQGIAQLAHGNNTYTCFDFLKHKGPGKPNTYEGSWVEEMNRRGYATPDKRLRMVPGGWHVLVQEDGNEKLLAEALDWMDERVADPRTQLFFDTAARPGELPPPAAPAPLAKAAPPAEAFPDKGADGEEEEGARKEGASRAGSTSAASSVKTQAREERGRSASVALPGAPESERGGGGRSRSGSRARHGDDEGDEVRRGGSRSSASSPRSPRLPEPTDFDGRASSSSSSSSSSSVPSSPRGRTAVQSHSVQDASGDGREARATDEHFPPPRHSMGSSSGGRGPPPAAHGRWPPPMEDDHPFGSPDDGPGGGHASRAGRGSSMSAGLEPLPAVPPMSSLPMSSLPPLPGMGRSKLAPLPPLPGMGNAN